MAKERTRGPFEEIGETVGGVVGKAVGRVNDLALNVAGSLFGAAVQTLGEWWSSPDVEKATASFGETEDRACREHYASSTRERPGKLRNYETARPLYQFGYVAGQNPDYQTRPFDQVEADLERAWEALGRDRFADWPEIRDQVSFGYTFRSPGAPNPS